jgi:hypothetical protein
MKGRDTVTIELGRNVPSRGQIKGAGNRCLTHPSLLPALQLSGQGRTGRLHRPTHPYALDTQCLDRHHKVIYTIFEGTSEIQRLIIARAISGVHIQ